MLERHSIYLCFALILLSVSTHAEVYLRYGEIKGDVTDEVYKDWIELNAIGTEMERSVEMTDLGSTQRGYANANFSKIIGQKDFTTSSPLLFLATANGSIQPTAEIHCVQRDGDGRSRPYFKIILRNALIDRFEQSASEDAIPSETISMAYTQIELRSTEFNDKTGTPLKDVTASYDLRTGIASGGGGTPPPDNTAPSISSIGAQRIDEDASITLNFTISDAQTSAGGLQLGKVSSNGTLLPSNRISLGGSGGSRTVTLNPVTNQFGSATVTLTVSDGSLSKSTAFTFTVSPENDRPIIMPSSSIQVVRTAPINGITIRDVDAETNTLSLAASVTQGSLFTNAVIPELVVQNNGFATVLLDGSLDTLSALFSHSSGLIYQSYPNFTGTDTLSLQLTDDQGAASIQQDITLNVFATAYDQWKETHFSSELSTPSLQDSHWGEQADPDGDGLPNLLEYVLGLAPNLPDTGHAPQLVKTIVDEKTHYTITIDRIIDPTITVLVEVCTNLDKQMWTSDVAEIDVSNVTPSAAGQQLTFQDQKPIEESTQRFYRITASRP